MFEIRIRVLRVRARWTCCLRVPARTNLRRPRTTQAQVIPTITT